ncbi:MAG: DUF4412 domain-containing protein [Bacteroidales bacterium]|nr:DUF4412 domain-containing protein [Bacteroidales bacterium]
MKRIFTYIVPAIIIIITILIITHCNPVTGDNKITKIDSAPKPKLAALTIRKDVPPVFTNNFNGNFQLVEKSLFDTVVYNIYVFNNKVRIDKIQSNINKESTIINLELKEVIILNHQARLYTTQIFSEEKTEIDSNYKIIKTENEKTILGIRCKQWRVKNVKENTEVTYWMATNNEYGFYYYLTKIWNPNIKTHKYYQIIPNSFGFLPFEAVERSLLRDIKNTMIITQIDKNIKDTSIFTIPSTYAIYTN